MTRVPPRHPFSISRQAPASRRGASVRRVSGFVRIARSALGLWVVGASAVGASTGGIFTLAGGVVAWAASPVNAAEDPAGPDMPPPAVEAEALGEIRNLHRCGSIWIAGQPSEADFALLKAKGITRVVSFRTDGEVEWDEAAVAKSHGIEFKQIPYASTDSLTKEVFAETRELLRNRMSEPILLHCGAAPRVCAVWLAYRVLDEKVPLAQAQAEAEKMGLRSKALLQKSLEYIRDEQLK